MEIFIIDKISPRPSLPKRGMNKEFAKEGHKRGAYRRVGLQEYL